MGFIYDSPRFTTLFVKRNPYKQTSFCFDFPKKITSLLTKRLMELEGNIKVNEDETDLSIIRYMDEKIEPGNYVTSTQFFHSPDVFASQLLE